jgi:hypothetical protein
MNLPISLQEVHKHLLRQVHGERERSNQQNSCTTAEVSNSKTRQLFASRISTLYHADAFLMRQDCRSLRGPTMSADPSKETTSPVETPIVEVQRRRPRLRPSKGLLFALIGAGLTWICLQATFPIFSMPEELAILGGMGMTAEQTEAQNAARDKAARQNAMFYLALLGALVGSGLSLAEVTKYPSPKAAALGGITVFILGGLFGAASAFLGDTAYASARSEVEPLSLVGTVLVQIVTLTTLGMGIGIGLSAFRGSFLMAAKNRVPAGILAGICAGMLYPMAVGIVLPYAQTESTLPMGPFSQLMWMMSAACLLGIIIPGVAEVSSLPHLANSPKTDEPVPGEP